MVINNMCLVESERNKIKGKVLKVILEKMMSEIMPVKRSGALTLSHDGE